MTATTAPRLWHVQLKFPIRSSPDAAWTALHSPEVLAALYGPLIAVEPLSPGEAGGTLLHTAVRLRLFGLIPLGTQLIAAYDETREHDGETVRILRDSGIPLTGPLSGLDVWDHRMALSALPGGRTLWRDRLVFGGGGAALLWPGLWLTWQWRGWRIRWLARTWNAVAAHPNVGLIRRKVADPPPRHVRIRTLRRETRS